MRKRNLQLCGQPPSPCCFQSLLCSARLLALLLLQAYNPKTGEHTLRFGDVSRNLKLLHYKWESKKVTYTASDAAAQAAQAAQAAASTAGPAKAPAAAAGGGDAAVLHSQPAQSAQQRKRKQQQEAADRSVRARPAHQQAGAATAGKPHSAAAGPPTPAVTAPGGGVSTAGGGSGTSGSRSDAAHSASSTVPAGSVSTAQQQQRTCSKAAAKPRSRLGPLASGQGADAAAVVMRAATEPAKPDNAASVAAPAPAIGQEGSARSMRHRQASKRLTLPGEQPSSDEADDAGKGSLQHHAGSSKAPSRLRQSSTAAAGFSPSAGQAGLPMDTLVLQAAAAAHAVSLPAGQGVVRWLVPSSGTVRSLDVELQDFVLGNPIRCHIDLHQEHGSAYEVRLFQQVGMV